LLILLLCDYVDEVIWDEVEEMLFGVDFGVGLIIELIEWLRMHVCVEGIKDCEELCVVLCSELVVLVDFIMDCLFVIDFDFGWFVVVFVVGVNGIGKMIIVGKLVCVFVVEDCDVLFGVVDIFCVVVVD